MTFDYDAYEKVFPKTDPAPVIDSAVDGYTPTADELAGKSSDNSGDPTPENNSSSGPGTAPAEPIAATPAAEQPATPPENISP